MQDIPELSSSSPQALTLAGLSRKVEINYCRVTQVLQKKYFNTANTVSTTQRCYTFVFCFFKYFMTGSSCFTNNKLKL